MMRLRILFFITVVFVAMNAFAEVVRVGRWHLHSSFWMGLHQTLMHDASARTPRNLSALTAEQKTIWDAAVAVYRAHAGEGSITFSDAMMAVQAQLTQVVDDAQLIAGSDPVIDALRRAAPVYREHWWAADDRANRFYIGYAAAMLRDAGEEIAAGHEQLYGAKFPESIRVDVAPYGGQFGAYTHTLQYGGLTLTISSRDAGNMGLAALELILHESSHGIVGPRYGSVAKAIATASRKRNIDPPRDLWHAILFATTSELTRRALAARGATEYVPFSRDLLTRAWPQYREPIERFWIPYVNGSGTLEDAIDKVVAAHVSAPPRQ